MRDLWVGILGVFGILRCTASDTRWGLTTPSVTGKTHRVGLTRTIQTTFRPVKREQSGRASTLLVVEVALHRKYLYLRHFIYNAYFGMLGANNAHS
jgi:hypothetical protein